ncbi:MAG: protein-glutamate O-methyltransferase CheR [Pseudomonadota bacterium]
MSAIQPGITLSDSDFRQIAGLAAGEAGLAIPESKKSLVQSRVARRMRALGFKECKDYLATLNGNEAETQHLISALTTNVSSFFRETHHFEHIRDAVLKDAPKGRLRFWSAGCSNGQEPYSLAIEVLKAIPDAARHDVLILASDIDRNVLAKAERGIYSASEIDGIPKQDRASFLQELPDGTHQVIEAIRNLVRFRQLNLNAGSWPMKGPFDAIFCRNVVIYFNDDTQAALWPRFRAMLKPNGLLMLGHSERLHPIEGSGFEAVGVTTYRKL